MGGYAFKKLRLAKELGWVRAQGKVEEGKGGKNERIKQIMREEGNCRKISLGRT
jgi:hypothetical protein